MSGLYVENNQHLDIKIEDRVFSMAYMYVGVIYIGNTYGDML